MKRPCRKHDWRKVGAIYTKDGGLMTTTKRCAECGEERRITEDKKGIPISEYRKINRKCECGNNEFEVFEDGWSCTKCGQLKC